MDAGDARRGACGVARVDAPLALEPGASKADLERAMRTHVLAEGELVGTYARAR